MENKVCECDGRGNYYSNNPRFKSLSYYYRMADRFIHQAELYRNEGNTTDLYITLDRYCSLISKMPQHPSYSTYSAEQRFHHDKIRQEFSKELENLKLQIGHIPQVQENTVVLSTDKSKAGYCDEEEERTQSFINVNKENMILSFAITTSCGTSCSRPGSSTSFIMGTDCDVNVNYVTQCSPSPVLSFIQSMPQAEHVSHINSSDSGHGYSQTSYQDVHIPVRLMEDFLDLARDNTNNDLETCGVLGAFLKNGIFYVTTLIIPKQETTSSSCQALNEEEIYAIQSEHALFPVGWIHTHPSQACFMSSIDLHTQYSYQVMLPEAVAIVMAPTDPTRTYGIFRICEPGGTTVLKECHETGFHPHQEPSDGSPIYEDCSNVYLNPNLRFEIFDLR